MTGPRPGPPALEITTRPMTEADVDRVHAIERAGSPDAWSRSLFADELADGGADRYWLVAESAGRLTGFGGLLFVTDEAHVMNMGVGPEHRRQGVASVLLARLLLAAGDRGATAATLEVRASNHPAIGLYEGFGFAAAGHRPGYYADGEDAVIMWAHGIYKPAFRDRLIERGGGA